MGIVYNVDWRKYIGGLLLATISIFVISLFKDRNPFMVPVLLLVAFGLKFAFISNPLPAENPTSGGILDTVLYKSLWVKLHPVTMGLFTQVIIIISGLYLNFLLNSRRMFQKINLLPALSFILFTSLFAGIQRLHSGIVMLPVTILLLHQVLLLYHTSHPRTTVVNIGLIAGFGTLLYHPYWWMLPFCIIGLAQMRPFRFNEWILLIISFLIPAYIILSYEYLTNQWNPSRHWPVWNPLRQLPAFDTWWAAAIGISLIWILSGISQWLSINNRALIQTRKNWYLTVILGIFILPTLFYPQGNLYEGLTLLLVPASALGSFTFLGQSRPQLRVFFFWMVLISAAIFSWAVSSGRWV